MSGIEDAGFLAIVHTSRVDGREAAWSLGLVGVGAAAVVGMHLMASRSQAEKTVKVGRMRRMIEFDPQTGRPKINLEIKAKQVRTKRFKIGKKGARVEGEGIVVEEEEASCPFCGKDVGADKLDAHIASDHGDVQIVDPDKKARRKPRKRRLDEIRNVLTAEEWDQIVNPRYETGVAPMKLEAPLPGGLSEEAAESPKEMARRRFIKEFGPEIGYAKFREWEGEPGPISEKKSIGVQKRKVKYADEELDLPLLPLSDAGLQVLLVQTGTIAPPPNYEEIATQYALETGQSDPNDLEVDVTFSSDGEGVTTLRNLGITHYQFDNPVLKEQFKDVLPEMEKVEVFGEPRVKFRKLRGRIDPRTKEPDPERTELMREAVRIIRELEDMQKAKERRKEIERCWPEPWKPPVEADCPDYIWQMYYKRKERDDAFVERMRDRMMGRGAGRFYTWENEYLGLNAIPMTWLEDRDENGKFIYGYIVEDEYGNKVPIELKSYSPAGQLRLNEIIRNARKHTLVPPELANKAKAGVLTDAEKKEIAKRQKEIGKALLEDLSRSSENFTTVSAEMAKLMQEPFGRKRVSPSQQLGFGVRQPRRTTSFKPGKR